MIKKPREMFYEMFIENELSNAKLRLSFQYVSILSLTV